MHGRPIILVSKYYSAPSKDELIINKFLLTRFHWHNIFNVNGPSSRAHVVRFRNVVTIYVIRSVKSFQNCTWHTNWVNIAILCRVACFGLQMWCYIFTSAVVINLS